MAKPVIKRKPKAKPVIKPKQRYSAAGMDETGADRVIMDAEYKRHGMVGYPWSKKLKAQMKGAINGLRNMAEIKETIDRLAEAETPKR